MATVLETNRRYCFVCEQEKVTYKCDGCMRRFCKNHVKDHEDELELQLNGIEYLGNIFRQTISEHIEQPNKQHIIQKINQWEQCSIEKIQQTAEENRQIVLKHINHHFTRIKRNLQSLMKEIKEIRQENDFNELNLNDFKNKLQKLEKQLNNPTNISLQEENSSSTSFINKIYMNIEHLSLQWKQNGLTVAGGNGPGHELSQLNKPWSIYVDDDQTIYIADYGNHRIIEWKKDATCGQIVAGGNGQGNGNHQLCFPTKVIIDKVNDCFIIADRGNKRVVQWPRHNGTCGETIIKDIACIDLIIHKNKYLYVCNDAKDEVRRWKLSAKQGEGVVVAGGNDVNQVSIPQFIFIDDNDTLYVSEYHDHRVTKWMKGAKKGVVIAGEQDKGNSLKQLYYPHGILVDKSGAVYIADTNNDRIVRWIKDAKEGSIMIGGNNREMQSNELHYPTGLSFDNEHNLYVVDHFAHRIQKFVIDK